jgi:phenylacetate-CoA ligase
MFLDLILSIKGFPIRRAKQDLVQIRQLSAKDFSIWQNQKSWEAARYHFENNCRYRKLFKSGFPDKWDNLPIVQKSDLQGNLNDLISAPFRRSLVYIGSTSGSSGHPFFFAKDKYAHAMTYALIANRYASHGLSLRQKQARFYGIPMSGKSKWLEIAKDLAFSRVRFPVFDLSEAKMGSFLEKFAATKFQYLYGYTSALVLFAQYLVSKSENLKTLCPSIKACIVTSEVCNQDDQYLLEKAFGIPVLNEYGASELDVIAFTNKTGAWELSVENLLIEVLNEHGQRVPDGKEGRIVITSLHNRAFPMVRYDIGDIGSIANNGHNKLLSLSGRTNDIIVLPSGKKAAGLTFYYISRRILESGGTIKEFIVKQTAIDKFLFEVVADQPLSIEVIEAIESAMLEYLESGLSLEVKNVTQIHRPSNGKAKHFYSLLP